MSDKTRKIDVKAAIAEKALVANDEILRFLDRQSDIPAKLHSAMQYTLDAPGKRIRAGLVLWCCEIICGKVNQAAIAGAIAIEMVHTYSLVHDDLPAMDDDDMRRGRASCHTQFDEATAILAGDGLLTLAFEVLASEVEDKQTACKMIEILAKAAGPAGMIGGQIADLENEGQDANLETLEYIHLNKTAKMFAAAVAMGAVAGNCSDEQLENLTVYGLKVGLGFQIADDILDVSATSSQLGKTAGKDAEQGKLTYPAIMGIEKSKATAKKLASEAIDALAIFDGRADILDGLAMELLERTQ